MGRRESAKRSRGWCSCAPERRAVRSGGVGSVQQWASGIVDFFFHRCARLDYSRHHFAQTRDIDLQIADTTAQAGLRLNEQSEKKPGSAI